MWNDFIFILSMDRAGKNGLALDVLTITKFIMRLKSEEYLQQVVQNDNNGTQTIK